MVYQATTNGQPTVYQMATRINASINSVNGGINPLIGGINALISALDTAPLSCKLFAVHLMCS
ncbi:hypothetical protein [Enterococcus hirae]|uniref:hypothetical protein n=1 Tax=Enterococcus hirae TaxID=1354 RepID=UPI0039A567CA